MVFLVSDRKTGRKIGYEFSKVLVVTDSQKRVNKSRLEDPEPIDDVRLDGNQISFCGYGEDFTPESDIEWVEIFMRYHKDDLYYYSKYENAIKRVVGEMNE